MIIAGIQKNSFIDFRGKVATVVFTPLCNFDCFYCHNSQLLKMNHKNCEYIDEEEFFSYLNKRHGLIDGIVISGGEPTLQPDLEEFIKKIKEMGYAVKLDTNGYEPDILENLINKKLLDYVAMDIKAPFDQYEEIINRKIDFNVLKKSIAILMNSDIEYEFRTTVIPTFTLEDIEAMAKEIKGALYYVLQQFTKPEWEDRMVDIRNKIKPHHKAFFLEAQKVCMPYVQNAEIKNLKE
ncbi:MAG: anaerobic ribonucleoside-triphosphate reductase activating protein [Clostridia bacterium]|nr:anaerobic ribonucleoside-triphosphate reductase activating protein [Clostridia bacterium]